APESPFLSTPGSWRHRRRDAARAAPGRRPTSGPPGNWHGELAEARPAVTHFVVGSSRSSALRAPGPRTTP
ncbi:MAG: hypothetical protein ACRDV9_14430, partial [Acidimicrobiia bacterium]